MSKFIKKHKWLFLIGVVILIGGAGFLLWGSSNQAQASTSTEEISEVVAVARGNLQDSIESSGNLAAAEEQSLALSSSGVVKEIYVAEGDEIKAGAPLLKIDTTLLEISVAQAEASLKQAQIQLESVKAGPSAAELAAAKASVTSAQASYAQTKATGTSESQLITLKAAMDVAARNVQLAQLNYDVYGPRMAPALQNATLTYDSARLAYEIALKQGPSSSSLTSSWSQVQQAQATLKELQSGATAAEIEAANLKVQLAQLSLDKAQRALDAGTLTAPFAGVITGLTVDEGERASGSGIVTMANLKTLEVSISLDESDVVLVHTGQTVQVTVEALDGVVMTGTVTAIAPVASVASGVALYPVTVQLTEIVTGVRPAMTVDVAIITENLENVLYLPQRAVRMEGEQAYVMRQTGTGTYEKTVVTLGKSLGGNVEIKSGLAEGDVIGVVSEVVTDDTTSNAGGGFGGLGRIFGGGGGGRP